MKIQVLVTLEATLLKEGPSIRDAQFAGMDAVRTALEEVQKMKGFEYLDSEKIGLEVESVMAIG